MTTLLSPVSSRLYGYLCANVEVDELCLNTAELAAALDQNYSVIRNAMHSLYRAGFLRAEFIKYCDGWNYYMALPHASYEIRRNSRQQQGVMDEYTLRQLWEY